MPASRAMTQTARLVHTVDKVVSRGFIYKKHELYLTTQSESKYKWLINDLKESFPDSIALFFAYIAIQDAAFPNSWICPPDSFWNVLSPSKTTEALMLARKK